jgi:hypothetical protein
MIQMRALLFAVIATLALWSGCAPGDSAKPVARTVKPPALTPVLKAFLDDCDQRYDAGEQMLLTEFRSPGYHTRIASGTPVHPTRESLIYALALLQRNAAGDTDRAASVIRRVVGLQDSDPVSKTYGVWPWLLEESLAEMESPDLNWADFCGSQLAHMLVEQADKLPADLQDSMRESLLHAVRAIRRRNVGPGYTNIAVLGGSVCVIAGELFGDVELLAYGRQRLQGVVRHVEQHGGFSEYNSPPYSKVVIGECERMLHLARDLAGREAAESLRRTCWKDIAASFHPATGQWAGPHSRTSRVHLQASTVEFLSLRTGVAVEMHPTMADKVRPGRYATVPPLPCPAGLVWRFQESVEQPQEIRRVFARDRSGAATVVGTTWQSNDACLGSVNRSSCWTQRKPLIAYWTTADDPAVVFRVRFLHDGKDFASMGVLMSQKGPRALCLFESIPNRGDWHRTLDRPADGIFQATDFRVRFELRGVGATAKPLGAGRYMLAAGGHCIVIHTLPGRFAGSDVVWVLGEDGRSLEGICYSGPRRNFDFSSRINVALCAAIELLRNNEVISDRPPQLTNHSAGRIEAKWEIPGGDVLEVNTSGK